jgi:thiol-disulfide isomerase/thioredoxin
MLLQQIADRVFTQNIIGNAEKPICNALIENSRKCLKGFSLPILVGKDLKNKRWDDTNITGKLTYVVFYATWNAYSMKQLQALERLAIKFNGAANFVAISLDEDEQAWRKIVQNKKWKSQMVYLGDQPEVREQCCLNNIPLAILLDDQGVYINDYTRLPEDPLMGVQIERWLLANPDKAGKGTWKEN